MERFVVVEEKNANWDRLVARMVAVCWCFTWLMEYQKHQTLLFIEFIGALVVVLNFLENGWKARDERSVRQGKHEGYA
jgi:hypothetical protein